jgi:competence protein ComEC
VREERDFKLLFLGLALWIGSATVGLLHSYWLLLSLPLFLLIGRKYGTFLLVIALVGSFNIGLHQIALTHNALRPFMENKTLVHLIAQVKSDPKLGSAKVVGSTLRPASTTFLATSLVVEGGKMRLPLRFSTYQHITFSPGTVIESEVLIYPTQERSLAALVVTRGPIVVLHGPGVMGRLTTRIRTAFKLQVHKLSGDGANLIPGLVLGDTSLESSGFINQMRRAGLTHLTAVSGENFAIISAFLLWAMQWIFRRLRTRIIITSFSLIGFIYLVRPSPSVMRASVMTAALLFARARGAKAGGLPALGLAITVLILIDPFQSVDPGFALSVGATAGILVLVPILTARNIPEPIAIPLAATIFCTPIIIAISGQFSLISIPANLLVSAAVAPITVAGFIASLLSPIFPSFSFLIVAAVLPFSSWIAFIAHHASEISILVLPKSFMGAGLACLALYGLFKKMWKIGLLVILIVSIYFYFQSTAWPHSNWRIVNCDVGQGDGEVINLGNHQAIVIDTGPDPVLMDQCLKSLRIITIPLLVLTHSHADHIAGLSGVLKGRAVGQIWRTATQGQHFEFKAPVGQVDIRVLWPKDPQARFEVNPGDGSAVNNTSIALLIDIAGLTFFTGGDVEPPAQQAILESGLVHRVDIMKISHHGSAYQYLPLLDALHPTVAFISVGKGNTYGHPALSTLTVLRDRGVAVYRTDVSGALEYDADKSVHTHRKGVIALA